MCNFTLKHFVNLDLYGIPFLSIVYNHNCKMHIPIMCCVHIQTDGETVKPKILIRARAVEIPYPTCPTWSHFIQGKLKITIHLSLDKCKICIKLIIMSSHVALKTVWILISWLLQKPADLDLHSVCLQESCYQHGFILFRKV